MKWQRGNSGWIEVYHTDPTIEQCEAYDDDIERCEKTGSWYFLGIFLAMDAPVFLANTHLCDRHFRELQSGTRAEGGPASVAKANEPEKSE